jgi:shikimate dehydrogenase
MYRRNIVKQVGLIGYPVLHSLSPQMHQAAFDALGIDARYSLWETPPGTLKERIASLLSPEVLGANVTIPYKREALPLIDECDPLAARIGAINTIIQRDGRLIGHNTDAPGFIRALAEYEAAPFKSRGKRVVILGTGGAARAAAVALLENSVAELVVLGRTSSHVDELLSHLRTLIAVMHRTTVVHGTTLNRSDTFRFLHAADLLVNATSVGLQVDETAALVDIHALQLKALVMDMVFNPPLTPLLQAAQAHGCSILNGLSMLLYQGALAFELWTGYPAPIACMRAALGLI